MNKLIHMNEFEYFLYFSESRAISLPTFKKIWLQLLPHIITAKPMTDLCWTCQRNNRAIYRSANLAEEDKSVKVKAQQDHLQFVFEEASFFIHYMYFSS